MCYVESDGSCCSDSKNERCMYEVSGNGIGMGALGLGATPVGPGDFRGCGGENVG